MSYKCDLRTIKKMVKRRASKRLSGNKGSTENMETGKQTCGKGINKLHDIYC